MTETGLLSLTAFVSRQQTEANLILDRPTNLIRTSNVIIAESDNGRTVRVIFVVIHLKRMQSTGRGFLCRLLNISDTCTSVIKQCRPTGTSLRLVSGNALRSLGSKVNTHLYQFQAYLNDLHNTGDDGRMIKLVDIISRFRTKFCC